MTGSRPEASTRSIRFHLARAHWRTLRGGHVFALCGLGWGIENSKDSRSGAPRPSEVLGLAASQRLLSSLISPSPSHPAKIIRGNSRRAKRGSRSSTRFPGQVAFLAAWTRGGRTTVRRRPRRRCHGRGVAQDARGGSGVDGSYALLVQSAFSQRAAASALSSGRVLNAIAASGAALCPI
jgi:hypothetical protein